MNSKKSFIPTSNSSTIKKKQLCVPLTVIVLLRQYSPINLLTGSMEGITSEFRAAVHNFGLS